MILIFWRCFGIQLWSRFEQYSNMDAAIKLKINQDKTKKIVFSSKKIKPLIKIRMSVLKTENRVRCFGFQFDRSLSFSEHIWKVKIVVQNLIHFSTKLQTCYRLSKSRESIKATFNYFINMEYWLMAAPQQQSRQTKNYKKFFENNHQEKNSMK